MRRTPRHPLQLVASAGAAAWLRGRAPRQVVVRLPAVLAANRANGVLDWWKLRQASRARPAAVFQLTVAHLKGRQ